MSKETTLPAPVDQPVNVEKQASAEATPTPVGVRTGKDEALKALRELQENAGQITEFEIEEKNLVNEFFSSLLKILETFGKNLELSVSSLPENYAGRTSKAYLYPVAQLVLVNRDSEVEIVDLAKKENRELLVEIIGEIMLKMKTAVEAYKAKTEERVNFLMPVTEELQKVAKVFSEE